MHQDLQRLKRVWASDEWCTEFTSRKATHNEDEIKKMCDVLPTSFFKDTEQMFDKHFVKQWCREKLVKLTLASIPEISTAFSRWLRNIPIGQRTMNVNLHDSFAHLPSFINVVSNNAPPHLVKTQYFSLSFPRHLKYSLGRIVVRIHWFGCDWLQRACVWIMGTTAFRCTACRKQSKRRSLLQIN